MTERRFSEDEVAEILAQATRPSEEGRSDALPSRAGPTLAELQSIAAEVGISPDRVATAARDIAARAAAPAQRTLLGLPRSAARIVPLEEPVSDDEWDRLVAHLRGTFGAVGTVEAHGTLRSWRNGNLQAHVEPDGEGGWRLRMQTFKEDAISILGAGAGSLFFGLLLIAMAVFADANPRAGVVGGAFMLGGAGVLAYFRVHLPAWARERTEQFEGVAARVRGLLGE